MLRITLAFACLLWATSARAEDPSPSSAGRVLMKTFGYLPSRVIDGLDPFRLRLRIGSGNAVSARATEKADFFAGSYSGIYAGLPGPRVPDYSSRLRPPLGLEARAVVALRPSDVASGGERGPRYSPTEFAVGFQFYVFGLDVGLDPVELADWLVGFVGIDLRGDDIMLRMGN